MKIKLYERRYWDIQAGKVFSVFDMDPESQIFKNVPASDDFWAWIDPHLEVLEIDIHAAVRKLGYHRPGLARPGVDDLSVSQREPNSSGEAAQKMGD